MIVKKGRELPAGILASVFIVLGGVCLLTPLRDQISRHGFPVWVLGVALAFAGIVLWIGIVQNFLHARRK